MYTNAGVIKNQQRNLKWILNSQTLDVCGSLSDNYLNERIHEITFAMVAWGIYSSELLVHSSIYSVIYLLCLL